MTRKQPPVKRIGRYSIKKTLGAGGMGTVFLAHDPVLDRTVALKLGKCGDRKDPPRRFLREALATGRLQHPGIPPVYALEDSEYGVFYTMKPIDGRSLREILDDLADKDPATVGEWDLFALVEMFRNICQTIAYAHSMGIIHRDIKPSNIHVGEFGEVYVMDWGLAKNISRESVRAPIRKSTLGPSLPAAISKDETLPLDMLAELTRALASEGSGSSSSDAELTLQGEILGTPLYMSPEQALGERSKQGPANDIYSLGAILYEMLTLKPPITAGTWQEVIHLKTLGQIVPPEELAPDRAIPSELSAIVMQALALDPDERYKSVKLMLRSIENWFEGKSAWRFTLSGGVEQSRCVFFPKRFRNLWRFDDGGVTTVGKTPRTGAYLFLPVECYGDARISLRAWIEPAGAQCEAGGEIAVTISAALPGHGKGARQVDGYTAYFGADGNTRVKLERNGVEVAANEYFVLEPGSRYDLSLERIGDSVLLKADKQEILTYRDPDPLTGALAGFVHAGRGVHYDGIGVAVKGMPMMVSALSVPEALMQEGCFRAAKKRFLSIANAQRRRWDGARARYLAGLASYKHDRNRRRAQNIWEPLQKTPFAVLDALGRAKLEIESGRNPNAVRIVRKIVAENPDNPYMEPLVDEVFNQVHQQLRTPLKTPHAWKQLDDWVRLALILGRKYESREQMLPSILRQWLFITLERQPGKIGDCTRFLGEHFGKAHGEFAATLTIFDPLFRLIKRSARVANNAFLIGRLMRLILAQGDRLENLETIAHFYLATGHDDVALRIASFIVHYCLDRDEKIPPRPVALMTLWAWAGNRKKEARSWIRWMIENSTEWAPFDGKLFLGLDLYERQKFDEARTVFGEVEQDRQARQYNRHLVAGGLLGRLPPDPVKAKIPNRSDHRLFFCLMVGYRSHIDYEKNGDVHARDVALRLFEQAYSLQRPSYDVYAASDLVVRGPLERLGRALPPRETFGKFTEEEDAWITRLTKIASAENAPETKRRQRPTSGKRNRRTVTGRGTGGRPKS